MNGNYSKFFVPAAMLGLALLPLAAGAQGQYTPDGRVFRGADHGYYYQGGPDRPQEDRGLVSWSGDVDDTVIVTIHGDDVDTRTVRGKDTRDVRVDSRHRLPHFPARVFLQRTDGRGEIRIVEQPRPENDFTARVRIHDPRPGASHYHFVLGWEPLGRRPDRF